MRRNVLGMILAGIMVVSVTGCGGSAAKDGERARNAKIQVSAKVGGGTDAMIRALVSKTSAEPGSTTTIVNNTDGGGVIVCEKAAAGKRDGSVPIQWHLIMLIKIAVGLHDKSVTEGFTVTGVAVPKNKANNALVVSGGSSYQTLDDLIGVVKGRPGEAMFGVKTGEMVHTQTELFVKAARIDAKYVEAGSDTEKLAVLVRDSIGACFANANQVRQYMESDKVRTLGAIFNSDEGGHSSMLPEVPDLIGQSMDFSFRMPNVVLAGSKDMDSELVSRIHDYYVSVANDAEVIKILTPTGMEVEFLSLEEGGGTLKEIQEQTDTVVEELGLRKQQE